jgi:serine/threonine protein kinase
MSVSQALIAQRYRLTHPLGSGGMARVWLARDEVLHRDVAIKEVALPSGLTPAERTELINRTLREARTAARLSHPNVVQIYDVVHTEDRPWIVMEYIRSRSLQQIITQEGPLPPDRVASIGLSVLAALTAAHDAGVLHRDIKPGNVLVAEDGRVVLTDFGLATFDGGEGSVTRPGLVWASPEYVAPERARLGASSVETDMWSLGATLYAAVEGHSPYARSTAMATLTALATEKPAVPQRAGPLKPVLSGLLRKDARTRLRADELERLLRRVAGIGPKPRQQKRLPRQRQDRDAPTPQASVEQEGAAAVQISSDELRKLGEEPTSLVSTSAPGTDDSATALVAEPRRRRRLWVVAAAAVIVVTVAAALLVYGVRQLDRTASVQPEPPAVSTIASPGVPAVLSPRREGEDALPDGWGYWQDAAGFRMAIPEGWLVSREVNEVYFHEPNGVKMLSVEMPTAPSPDPVAETRQREKDGKANGTLRAYELIYLVPLQYFERGAEWVYLVDNEAGKRMFVWNRRFLTKGGREYAITWMTRDYDRGSSRVAFDIIAPSFKPAS